MSFFINNSQIEYILEDNIVHKKKEKKKQSMSKKKKKNIGQSENSWIQINMRKQWHPIPCYQ